MRILIVKHVDSEGPGLIELWLRHHQIPYRIVDLWAMPLPPIDPLTHIILLGGPMNVYEEERYPFLRDEGLFIDEAIRREKRILGICLGAQLMAKSLGARVSKASEKEIGWHDVSLTRLGIRDPLFSGYPRTFPVFQWHEDTFDIPAGADLIVTSNLVPNQAFRLRESVYGLQFHLEVTADMVREWTKDLESESEGLQPAAPTREKILADTEREIESYTPRGFGFLRHFFSEGALK